MLNWHYFLIISILATGFENIVNRIAMQKNISINNYALVYNFTAFFSILIANIPDKKMLFSIDGSSIILLILSGVSWHIGTILSLYACKTLNAGLASVIAQSRLPIIVISSSILFDEQMTVSMIFGMIIIFTGILIYQFTSKLIFQKSDNVDEIKFNYAISIKFISSIFFAIVVLLDKKLTSNIQSSVVALSGYFLPCLYSLFFIKLSKKTISAEKIESIFFPLLTGFLSGIGYLTLIKSFTYTSINTVYPLFQLNIIVTILFSIFFLKENSFLFTKIFSSLLVLLGSIIILCQ